MSRAILSIIMILFCTATFDQAVDAAARKVSACNRETLQVAVNSYIAAMFIH